MRIIICGAAGFIGTNLAIHLAKDKKNDITLVDRKEEYFKDIKEMNLLNITIKEDPLNMETNFDKLFENQEIVYHLVSTTVPTTSNQHISQELISNVVFSSNMFEACVRCNVNRVIFISSGGTVYGKQLNCTLKEETSTYPISSYGVQKITIEKLLYLYEYMYGLDYRIIRLANPYGPYQRPNGVLGAITTFTYKALCNDEITVFGDGSVIRDYIYIDDAIRAIMNIANDNYNIYKIFNLGCGYGTSIKEVLNTIQNTLGVELKVRFAKARKVDVPVNYLDISRYEKCYGKLNFLSLNEGVKRTAKFLEEKYKIFEDEIKSLR